MSKIKNLSHAESAPFMAEFGVIPHRCGIDVHLYRCYVFLHNPSFCMSFYQGQAPTENAGWKPIHGGRHPTKIPFAIKSTAQSC